MNYKVSVIVPVYNCQEYIERCCSSLFEQTLDLIQFIFVNDGSTDNSVDIINHTLNHYLNRLNDVVIINRIENKGIAYSRQQGLDAAIGDFIIHCDADDWVEKNMYESLYETAIKENADVVCCGFSSDSQLSSKVILPSSNYKIDFNISPIFGSLCLRLISRKIFKEYNINFYDGINWGEDFLVSARCQVLAKKISVVEKPFYHYIQHGESTTHNITKEKCLELIKCGNLMDIFLNENGIKNKYLKELNYLKFQLKLRLLRDYNVRDIDLWNSIFPECHSDILDYPVPTYIRFSAWFASHNMKYCSVFILKVYDLYNKLMR
jgi:glycosyltransferase involved in cell wall biosynthesis